ncbi:uncharacterized protein LOC125505811 [Dendroctonus ponderosae]|uniref:Uncharacterized protein n=1 Tax=Dendroctonus ponderosae TaxID=77166 RepID=U4V0S2_DENPD|nr:uncharacterized protein LOC109545234 [Dendroctonus ponderosae]XP_048526379.1 uncharacterized protein LOC125505811 [Dendroctonus ponderosae]ERL86585.1 hypothetical protein D910_03992 [Dendroctonus ponderosae]ERL96270.1 hypothetical protein D910_01682 [Dendroctonus ponderosae]KAH0998814.1 hypothetical protein HUJ05_009645 [Dendroctonus ponderosae]KAH1026749.1 hypothetical protein HUJ05_000370 [Dendroctonus ponderosae]
MHRLLSFLMLLAPIVALPADRWPNLGPSRHEIVITPASDHIPTEYPHNSAKKEPIYHSTYAAINQIYPSEEERPSKLYPPPEVHSGYGHHTEERKHHIDEKLLRKHYEDYLDKQAKFKKNLLEKALFKTVDVTAKIAKSTVDFVTKIAIETAAKLAKNGAKHVIHKKDEKLHNPANHHYY